MNGQERNTAVWRASAEGEIQAYDWVYDDYRARYDVFLQFGWRLKLPGVYTI